MIYLVQAADLLVTKFMIGNEFRAPHAGLGPALLHEAGIEEAWLEGMHAEIVRRMKEYGPLIDLECEESDVYVEGAAKGKHHTVPYGARDGAWKPGAGAAGAAFSSLA